jgi:hypothetical protein
VAPPELRRSEAVFVSDGRDRRAFFRWIDEQRPETLIVGSSEAISWLAVRKEPLELVVMSRELAPEARRCAGIQQDYGGLGEAAAEQMLGLLSFNQTGIPANPPRIYLRGRWVDAENEEQRQEFRMKRKA